MIKLLKPLAVVVVSGSLALFGWQAWQLQALRSEVAELQRDSIAQRFARITAEEQLEALRVWHADELERLRASRDAAEKQARAATQSTVDTEARAQSRADTERERRGVTAEEMNKWYHVAD